MHPPSSAGRKLLACMQGSLRLVLRTGVVPWGEGEALPGSQGYTRFSHVKQDLSEALLAMDH